MKFPFLYIIVLSIYQILNKLFNKILGILLTNHQGRKNGILYWEPGEIDTFMIRMRKR